ncbi:MAG: hypothetical protein QOF37_1605 [Thermoleophilaceae bacterium]|jgi:hypothetical protein|nr:hypothetical protein [Thermoleophilaceae bacterium]
MLALAATALLVAGCGGANKASDQKQVSGAVTEFAHAFGKGDGKKACAKLTPAARITFVSRIESIVGTRDCAEAIGKLPALAGANVTGPFQTAKVDSVKVSGDTATARIIAAGHSAPVSLQRSNGEWLLTRVPGT